MLKNSSTPNQKKQITHPSDDNFFTTKLLMAFNNPESKPESTSLPDHAQLNNVKSSLSAVKKLWQAPEEESQPNNNGESSKQTDLVNQLVPDLARTHGELAASLKQQGKLEEAIAHYRQAIDLSTQGNSVFSGELVEDKTEEAEETEEIPPQEQEEEQLPDSPPANYPQIAAPKTNQAVEVYLQQAQAHYNHKEWSQTIEACKSALAIDENTAEAYKWWGNALQAQGSDREAMGYYGKALEIAPNLATVYVNVGNLFAKDKQWEQAIDYYEQALELEPNLAIAHRNLAKTLAKMGKTQEAAICRYQALSLEPEEAKAQDHFRLGEEMWELGLISESTACYRRAIRSEPNWAKAYEKLADALIRQGEVKEGQSYAQKAKELQQQAVATRSSALTLHGGTHTALAQSPSQNYPQENQAQRLLDQAQNSLNQAQTAIIQAQGAIKYLQNHPTSHGNSTGIAKHLNGSQVAQNQALPPAKDPQIEQYIKKAMLNPESAEIQADLGSLYAQKQDWNKAIACYQKALALDPKLARVHRNLAKVFSQAGKEAEATKSWYEALRLEPKAVNAQQHLSVGNSLVNYQQLDKAVVCYQNAIKLQPNLSEAYHRWGEILLKQGNGNKAVAVYRHGVKHNPTDLVCWYRLAEIYQTQKDWQKAMNCYQQLLKLQPRSPQLHNNYGKLLLQLNQIEEAEKHLRQAIILGESTKLSSRK